MSDCAALSDAPDTDDEEEIVWSTGRNDRSRIARTEHFFDLILDEMIFSLLGLVMEECPEKAHLCGENGSRREVHGVVSWCCNHCTQTYTSWRGRFKSHRDVREHLLADHHLVDPDGKVWSRNEELWSHGHQAITDGEDVWRCGQCLHTEYAAFEGLVCKSHASWRHVAICSKQMAWHQRPVIRALPLLNFENSKTCQLWSHSTSVYLCIFQRICLTTANTISFCPEPFYTPCASKACPAEGRCSKAAVAQGTTQECHDLASWGVHSGPKFRPCFLVLHIFYVTQTANASAPAKTGRRAAKRPDGPPPPGMKWCNRKCLAVCPSNSLVVAIRRVAASISNTTGVVIGVAKRRGWLAKPPRTTLLNGDLGAR